MKPCADHAVDEGFVDDGIPVAAGHRIRPRPRWALLDEHGRARAQEQERRGSHRSNDCPLVLHRDRGPRRYWGHGRGRRIGTHRFGAAHESGPRGHRTDARRHPVAGHHPRRDRPRAERRGGVRPRRTRPGGVVPGAALRDRPRRAGSHVRRHRHSPGHPRHPRIHPLRSAGQRRRGHPPRAPAGDPRRRRRAAAGQQPGSDVRQTRFGRTRFGDGGRRAGRRAGIAGDHGASHRNPPAHDLRHPAPHHRIDAAANERAGAHRRRPRHRAGATPQHPHAVADGTDPVVAVEDSGRDRDRPAVLPRGVLRGRPAGQRRGAKRAAVPMARYASC